MSRTDSRRRILEDLAQRLRQAERRSNEAELRKEAFPGGAREREQGGASERGFSTGIAALDEWLPRRGLSPGTLIEWLPAGNGCGAGWLALKIAAHVQR